MYFIQWVEDGKTKDFVAEGYIERLVKEEYLEGNNIPFTTKLVEEILAERI
ncbi:hypothetical protein [Priestia megaterium]|uniref:hypothetical protein n=1 Tax=Priestia megaterium TaxID=1404 RepID=UPI0015E3468E|nr:hypothetical protein [Priestia megaterium]